jgi:hypothetical protein
MENSELRSRNVARALASDTYAPAGQDQQSLFSAPATSALREEFRRTKLLTADSAMAILGDSVPEYLNDVIDFMASQREKARSGSFTMRDIVKAYFTTLGSIGADAINVSSFEAKTGLKVPAAFSTPGALSQAKIRPEEAVALWFFTPEGKAALDKTDAGTLDPADFEGLMKVRDAFGRNDIRNNGMREGGRKLSFKDLAETLKEVNQAKGDTQTIASALNRLSGISHGKIGFIKHLLGFGDVSTVDAVQINFWLTGQGTTNQLKTSRADLVRRLKSSEATDNLNRDVAKRIKAKVQTLVDRYGIDPDIGPHIIHHWLWDKAKGSQTTHKGMMSSMSLASPAPSPNNQAAAEAAFKGLSPIYRQVFQASLATPTPTPAQLAANFRVSERAIENIIGTVRTRIRANLETTTPDGLAPQGNTGRPDLGYSTVPSLQRVDQIRTEEGLPLQQTTDEIRSQADALLQRPNAVRSLIDTEDEWTAVQTAAANIALVNASLKGESSLEVAELAAAYREQGSRWSETGRARQDVHRSPAERHAMLISELLSSPDESAASGIKKAKTKNDRNAILQSWMARVKGIKEAMLHRGIDIDDAFERLNQQIADAKASESEASATHRQLVDSLNTRVQELEISLQQSQSRANSAASAAQKAMAEAEAARAQKALTEAQQAAQQAVELDPANTIRLELSRLSKRHRAVVEAMRDGATWDQAAAQTGMSVEDARKVMLGFIGALRKAAINTLMLAEDILLGRDQSLAAPSSLAAAPAESRAQRLGRIADSLIGAMGYSMDRFDRVSKPATAKKPGKAKKAEAPSRPMMSDEEFSARQNNPVTTRPVAQPSLFTDPQVLRDLYTYDQTLTRPQSRISFEEWKNKPEVKRAIERQGRMWAQPVSTTTGTLDMHDPASVLAAYRELAATRSSIGNKVIDFWRMSILTGPQTAIVNFASNAANSIYNLGPRRIIEAGVNDVLGIIGQGDPNSATLGELAVMARQSHKALKLAGENMLKSWATESRIAESQFAQTLQQMELGSLKGEEIMPALGGKFGLLMRSLSYRHMTAADEFFKGYHGHLEAAAQAHRIAKQEKLTGSAYEDRITELMKYGSEAWMRALAVSENVTFQTKLNPKDPRALAVLDKIAVAIRRYSHTKTGDLRQSTNEQGKKVMVPVLRPNALSFFFPFINTPTNIFKSAIEMSPVGALLAIIDGARALKIKIARGNMTKAQANLAASELYDRTRLVKDVTNQLISTGIFWALLGLVEPDEDDELPRITGTTDWRSTSKGARDNEMRVMPPMSIRIGEDNFISYSRIEPFATVFASIADAIHEVSVTGMNEKALGNYFTKIENQLSDKTFLSGLSDLINVWRDPERFASKLTGSIVTGFVPNLIRQPIREADPYVRDTKPNEQDGFFTALGKQLGYSLAPGYAPPMMDVWGNPVTRHQGTQIGSPGTDITLRVFDPSNLTIGKQIDPIDLYVWNWNRKAQNPKEKLSLEPIANFVMVTAGGEQTKVPLTPQEQSEANRNAGQAARKFLGDNWNTQSPTLEGIERIKDTVQRFQRFEQDKLRAKKLMEAR